MNIDKMKYFRFCFLFFQLIVCSQTIAQTRIFTIDSNYLDRHDIVYNTPAYEGFEGFPLGNGDLGGMIWNTNSGYEIQINKNDLFEANNEESNATLRNGVRLNIDLGAPANDWLYLNDFKGKLSLKNAQATFDSKTPFMHNQLNTWVSSENNLWFFELKSDAKEWLKAGTKMRISLDRWGSRTFPGWYGHFSKDTKSGLSNSKTYIKGRDIILEVTYKNLKFAVACRVLGEESVASIVSDNKLEIASKRLASNRNIAVIVSFVTSYESQNPVVDALALLQKIEQKNITQQKLAHQKAWHNFWKQSFVHLSNDYIENTYYLRRYLMASSSRGKFPVVFNGGLWNWNHDVRNWVTPHHWNTQQQYWGLAAQNDCELMLPYLNTYFDLMPYAKKFAAQRGAQDAILWAEPHDFFGSMTFWERGDMINNFTPASQIASLFWEYYQFTADTSFLRQKGYPFMKGSAAFYLQKLKWDSVKQQYYIFPSQAYESPRTNQLLNPITDRNMIISNFSNCIRAAQILDIDSKKVIQWQHVLDHMWDIPYRNLPVIGEVVDLAWYPDSSLFPKINDHGKWLNAMSQNTSIVFPAGILGIDQKNTRAFNAVSNIIYNHSPSVNAITPDPIVAARIGLGSEVLKMMENGIRRLQHFPQGLFYNIDHWYNLSRYKDSLSAPDINAQRDYIYDERSQYPNKLPAKPFIQSGLEPQSIYGAAVNEMLMQSNEGKIRIFPAIPTNWPAAFTLLARGAFLVSAEIKKDGTVPAVFIESKKGGECKLVNPWLGQDVSVIEYGNIGIPVIFKVSTDHIISFVTKPNKSYLIAPKNSIDKISVTYYFSTPNQAPKIFFEATLGKERNF